MNERKPMTPKEIDALLEQVGWPASMISLFIRAKLRELVRAVEAHYGIK